MPVAWLGLKARALAWLERAWAWDSSGQSPSPLVGLGLAWLGPEPGPETPRDRKFLGTMPKMVQNVVDPEERNELTSSITRSLKEDHPYRSGGSEYPSQGLRAWLGLENLQAQALGPLKPDVWPGLAWPERAWLVGPQGLRPGYGHH
ncbi:hypothetical protein FB451DRAFT_1171427 [Mycena latifolia]|nr:hypothetical protein FB451DRAFT_1171427 [Mycena latifolia]